MQPEPNAIVRAGYDRIAATYLAVRLETFTPQEQAFLDEVVASLEPGASVLDLGCGAGVPVTAALAAQAAVTGVDISWEQLALARERVPSARLVQADMASLALASSSFDAIVAFCSLVHVPRENQQEVFGRIASWLRPSGTFAALLGTGDNPEEHDPSWYGAPMYWSHFDADATLALVREAGLIVEHSRDVAGGDGEWLGVVARPAAGRMRP